MIINRDCFVAALLTTKKGRHGFFASVQNDKGRKQKIPENKKNMELRDCHDHKSGLAMTNGREIWTLSGI